MDLNNEMERVVTTCLENLLQQFGQSEEEKKKLLDYLEERVVQTRLEPQKSIPPKKPIRVYLDGCFDLMHAGHYNAIRQAKALGDILVVGVHSDAEILRNKGPTTMNEEERLYAVKNCKWVDEVVFDVPYSPSVELLDRHNCDFCVHGDDMPTDAAGNSAYGDVIKAGRIKLIKRTEGVSTTDLVGRMLLMTREHHLPSSHTERTPAAVSPHSIEDLPLWRAPSSGFLPTTRRIMQFAGQMKPRQSTLTISSATTIVYVDGNFDLFNAGHIELLEKAKGLGDFLLVGVHDDQTVNSYLGKNYPIMNLHERVLNVLSCKHVDEVILGAPVVSTQDMLVSMNITVVVNELSYCGANDEKYDSYKIPKERGIFQAVETKLKITTETVVERILTHHQRFTERNLQRAKKEQQYIETKQFIAEL